MEKDEEKGKENPNHFVLNDKQWKFIFDYYPEYGAAPFDMMTFLG
jgi:hypothetical protein